MRQGVQGTVLALLQVSFERVDMAVQNLLNVEGGKMESIKAGRVNHFAIEDT